MKKWQKLVLIAPLAILGLALFVGLGGWLVQALWNGLLPGLFGFPRLGFWQALGLLLLSRILFGGWSGGRSGGGRSRLGSRMRARMDERCAEMSPEERERVRQRMREKFGFEPGTSESGE